ncbi:hypothetical protein I41_26860 [Lacipirellula limnantheis]|uniref:Uncharacterized protein n=1 Tax=Lacipirellula limnantheis TaxID=2528024 RepID=A0A517TYP7_9BACT|nr:hypothetical protein I41_26860 [Lacipirellula limnantheis]
MAASNGLDAYDLLIGLTSAGDQSLTRSATRCQPASGYRCKRDAPGAFPLILDPTLGNPQLQIDDFRRPIIGGEAGVAISARIARRFP